MSRTFNSWATVLAVLAVTVLVEGGGAPARADEDVPDNVRAQIEDVLRQRRSKLLDEKNEAGLSFRRGSYSKSFRKVDDVTYQVTFHQDTAGRDRLKTERLLLTLKKDSSGQWSVAGEEPRDVFEGLQRGYLGDEEFYRFDRLSFDREGLHLTATNGFLMKDFFAAKPSRFIVVAADLAYKYEPPAELDFLQIQRRVLLKKYPEDFVFKPDYLRIECVAASCEEIEASVFSGLKKVALQETDPKLQKVYDDAKKDYDKNLKENPFIGFRLPPTDDRRTYTISIKKDSPKEYWIWLDYDNWEPWEVQFGTGGRGTVFGYYAEATRKAGLDPYELERRDDQDARDYDLESLKGTVELAIEDSEAISGDLTYRMTLKRDLRELPFFISRLRFRGQEDQESKNPKLFINSIQDGEGSELTWSRLGAFGGLVIFPKELKSGEKITLRLQFQSLDAIIKLNPSYSYVDRGGWLPFVRFGDGVEEFDLVTRVPDKYKTLGVGRKASETRKNGVLTTRWVADSPVTFPTVIFGDYIEDTPDIKATKQDGAEIPVHVYVDKVSTRSIDSFADAAAGAMEIRGSQLKALGDQAVNALNLYREIYGVDYPYAKLDLVNAPFFPGAQAPGSMIYLGSFLFRGEGTMASSVGGDATGIAKFLKDTVAHETAHQWWGSLIWMANFRNYWFVESLAEFSSALYVENVYGKKKYIEKVQEWRKNLLELEVITSVQDASALWSGEFPGAAYVANVYNKGPYAFHIMRETFGDEKFFAFLKSLAQELKKKPIVTRDIQMVAEKSLGVNMEWFFDQWIRGVGIPQYALFYDVRKTEDGKWLVQGKIKQRVTIGQEKIELPGVYYRGLGRLTFVFHNGKEFTNPRPIKIEGAETTFQLKLPEEPAAVTLNKYGELLAHDVLVNQSW